MEQSPLFHEDIYEALRTVVMALGGAKKVAGSLWPDKPADKAGELLNNCLNRTRNEKLDPEQVCFLLREGRKRGCHAAADFIGADAGYQVTPVEPEDEKAELQRQFIECEKALQNILLRLEVLRAS